MNLNLYGKNALVCGSSKGIGKAAAIELAALGANITLVARSEETLKQALHELPVVAGQQHDYIIADFSDLNLMKESVSEHISAKAVPYNILVNNTGGPNGGKIQLAEESEFIQAFSNHLLCNHILVKMLLPGMKQSGYGRIINIISTSVKIPLANLGVSNTIRGAVASWAKTMANELGEFGITVNNVLPGATETERLAQIVANKSEKAGTAKEQVEEEMKNEIPMKRFATPAEVGSAVAFLASPAAAYINGINLPVDGGRTGSL
jgi:3-oxoacyl-[acyl-carrier protein] reductase